MKDAEKFNMKANLIFIQETKEGKYSEIVKCTLETPRYPETIEYIDTEETDYYYSYDY